MRDYAKSHKAIVMRYDLHSSAMLHKLREIFTARPHTKIRDIEEYIGRWMDKQHELQAAIVEADKQKAKEGNDEHNTRKRTE